ncbi:NAD(P)/FAD-dependent oxidoreductase [Corynebacterium sp. H127]|uniref:flavin-containing monooxygenase n=1 Tax=Corynebacterium sp. H127 TaxID=3133418 RepID=UPI00309BC613
MSVEKVDVVVVGGGQSGIAASEHLTTKGMSHVVLEKDRLAERWRTGRWDSLVTNGPAWHDRFPSKGHAAHQDSFVPKDQVADYFASYADTHGGDFREGTKVLSVTRLNDGRGFLTRTTAGDFESTYVIAATGAFQVATMPQVVPADSGINQIHSEEYRNPRDLPAGGVLVVGSGSSGVQIAEELLDAGREVYLAVGPHDRPPRRYRDRDIIWWMGALHRWDDALYALDDKPVAMAMSGAKGGLTVDFRELCNRGMQLVGRAESFADGVMQFGDDLAKNIHDGDARYLELLREADEYVATNNIDLPAEPEAHLIAEDPTCLTEPIRSLQLAEAGISTIIWATGFSRNYDWLQVEGAVDENGNPRHHRGIGTAHGVYFVGLPWQSRRASSFIYGCWHDAKFVVDAIESKQFYHAYKS